MDGHATNAIDAIDANDPQTGRHVRRVATYSLIIAEAADLDAHHRRIVERVALFHDVGKIDAALFDIVHEGQALTRSERRAIVRHPQLGAEVLAPLSPFYPELADGVLSHHERWDGRGYPRRLRGERIPLCARIVTLADTFDAITHDRRYRDGRSAAEAANAIASGRGTQFDPLLVDLILSPDVLAQLLHAHREAHRRGGAGNERRAGREEAHAPDLTFRWRDGVNAPAAGSPAR